MKFDKILIPLDGSALAEMALGKALEIMDKERATLVLLRAAEAHTPLGGDPIEAQVQAVREAEEYLDQVMTRAAEGGATHVSKSVWYGPPAWSIVEAARFMDIDLIVMGSHGRSGLGRLILGSVAESVLRGTTVPILLLRSPEAPLEAPAGTAAEAGRV